MWMHFIKLELRRDAFSQKIAEEWKLLTENITSSQSLNSFKTRLDTHLSTVWFNVFIKVYPTIFSFLLLLIVGIIRSY